jgi:hypothetical protein
MAKRAAAKRSAARRAEVRRMILEQSAIEKRKEIITLATIFLFVIAAAFFLRNYINEFNFASLTNDRTSIGDPTKLSYQLPSAAPAEKVQITNKRVSPAMCESFGKVKCLEPVVNTFYVDNRNTGIKRYEQWIYLSLQNTWENEITIKEVEFMAGSNKICGAVNSVSFNIGPGQTSVPLEFVCIYDTSSPGLSAEMVVTYTDSLTGYDMTSGASLKII